MCRYFEDALVQVPPVREDGLQLEEHRRFQKVFWLIQRYAWALFGLVLVLAVSGMTGAGGYFARGTVVLQSGGLEYPRIARWQASDQIRVRFEGGGETHSLTFGSTFYDYFEVDAVQPEPERMLASASGMAMQFRTRTETPAQVVVYVRPLRPGLPRYPIHVDAVAAEVRSVVLP